MNWMRQILGLLAYLMASSVLVFSYSFFIPSLGHLHELGLSEGVLNLDHITPWGMVISAVLISLLYQNRWRVENSPGPSSWGIQPVLCFLLMWGERVFYIVQDHGPLILGPFILSAIWIPLFLRVTQLFSEEATALMGGKRGLERAGWGPMFFWTAVFFSFSIQLILNGYGIWGTIQAYAFLGLSYLEYRKLNSTGFLTRPTAIAFKWIYRASALAFSVVFLSRYLRFL